LNRKLQAKIEQEITILNLSAAAADTFFPPLQSKMVFFTQDKIRIDRLCEKRKLLIVIRIYETH
jgi:hypothetical protein